MRGLPHGREESGARHCPQKRSHVHSAMPRRRRPMRTARTPRLTATKMPAADCEDCHGSPHEAVAVADAKSPVSHANIPVTCGRCHGQKFLMESNGAEYQPFLSYQDSVHGRAVEKGSIKAAVCTDCHGSARDSGGERRPSPISSSTCRRHAASATPHQQTFMASIHGQAIARGNGTGAGVHGLPRNSLHQGAQGSQTRPWLLQNVSRDTCARCHEGSAFAGVWRAG